MVRIVTVEAQMRIGDAMWRKLAADMLRGVRRFDRKFAVKLRSEVRHMIRTRRGQVCGQTLN